MTFIFLYITAICAQLINEAGQAIITQLLQLTLQLSNIHFEISNEETNLQGPQIWQSVVST